MAIIPQLDRLQAQLLTSGLSQKNNALYQVIDQLIKALRQGIDELESQVIAITPAVVPSPPAITSTDITGLPPMPGDTYGEEDTKLDTVLVGQGLPYFKKGSIIFSDGFKLTEDNGNFFWDDTNNRMGIGKNNPGVVFDVLGAGVDIGYVANFRDNGATGSTFIKIESASGANNQAGFTFFQSTHALEWRFRVVGNSSPQDSVEITNTLNGQGMWLNTRGQISANVNGHAFETIIQQRMPMPIDGEDGCCECMPQVGTVIIP
jgi:hypothetical protein